MSDVLEPTQALVIRPQVLPSTAQFGIMRDLAIRLASAKGFLPAHYFLDDRGQPATGEEKMAKVLAAIEYGRAVRIEPMIALQNITMIKGRPAPRPCSSERSCGALATRSKPRGTTGRAPRSRRNRPMCGAARSWSASAARRPATACSR